MLENRWIFSPHPSLSPPFWENPLEFCDEIWRQKTGILGLTDGKDIMMRGLFTKQYVAYGEIGHFLCSVISQGKVVALDRWV